MYLQNFLSKLDIGALGSTWLKIVGKRIIGGLEPDGDQQGKGGRDFQV